MVDLCGSDKCGMSGGCGEAKGVKGEACKSKVSLGWVLNTTDFNQSLTSLHSPYMFNSRVPNYDGL